MTSETQCCDNVVTTLSDIATKIQPKPNVVTTSCATLVESQYYYYFDLPKIRVGRARTTKNKVAFS